MKRLVILLGVIFGLVNIYGCTSIDGISDTESPVYLTLDIDNAYSCSVDTGDGCQITGTIYNYPKAPLDEPTPLMDVIIRHIYVDFKRADSNEGGTLVPPSQHWEVTWNIPVDESIDFEFNGLLNDADIPPLEYLKSTSYDYDPETGNTYIDCLVRFTFVGQDRAGNDVSCSGIVSVIFY